MRVMVNGVDITDRYKIDRAVTRDSDGGEQDIFEVACTGKEAYTDIVRVKSDDVLTASMDGYSTGELYVHTAFGRDGKYALSARGTRRSADEKRWACYEDVTLMELMHLAAVELDMGFGQYGITDQKYKRLVRRDESWPMFLRRILRLESAVLKCTNGKLLAISIPWAQGQKAVKAYDIAPNQSGCSYNETFEQYRECVLEEVEVTGKAVDIAVPGSRTLRPQGIDTDGNKALARRWAAGELLCMNRAARNVEMELPFDPELAAMSRVDLTGLNVTQGKWLAGMVKHEPLQKRTKMILRPCIETIT